MKRHITTYRNTLQRLGKIFAVVVVSAMISGCNSFFDVVPKQSPKLEDAFTNRAMMQRGLFTAYSYLPDPTDEFYYPAYYTVGGEFSSNLTSRFSVLPAQQIYMGYQNTTDVQQNYWSGGNGGTSMFQAIRWCNIFLENANEPRDITEEERAQWIAEVKFLKAYYHFFLLKLYGPIPLIKENLPLSSTVEEVKIYREPVQECINYIVELIDEAVPNLPLTISNPIEELGRITQPIALAVKAKALVWAASPLFNGNQYYSHWVDKRGKQMVPAVEDRTKWEVAAQAIKEAIESAHTAGNQLYEYNKLAAGLYNMPDSLTHLMTIREAIAEKWNKGVIWASTERFTTAKSGFGGGNTFGNMQHDMYAKLFSDEVSETYGHMQAAFEMTNLFYSKNGVPIDEDKTYAYADRYKLRTGDKDHRFYIVEGKQTAGINFDREYRYYADLAFDRGYYELSTTMQNFGASCNVYIGCQNTSKDYNNERCRTGYNIKKLVSFRTSGSQNTKKTFTTDDYRFPLIRLADLYLLYSEALNEVKDAPDADVYYWIDLVRKSAGLKGVEESWTNYSSNPTRITSKDEMRQIIHRERLIELAFEGQRFWDVRRWHEADKWFVQTPQCWDKTGKTPETYYMVLNLDITPKFNERDYLWPLKASDVRINNNLVQTYGW